MVTRNYPATWTCRVLHLFFQYFRNCLMFFSPDNTQWFPLRLFAIFISMDIYEHPVCFPQFGLLGSFIFLWWFSSCLQVINTDFCLCSSMCLTRGGGKAFSSAVLWNSLCPICWFISFIFKPWLIPMANASFPLVFRYLQANFLHCACTRALAATVCRGRQFSSHLPRAGKPHWAGSGHVEEACLPVEPSSVPLSGSWVLRLAQSGHYLRTTSRKMFCLHGKKKPTLSWCHRCVWVLCVPCGASPRVQRSCGDPSLK